MSAGFSVWIEADSTTLKPQKILSNSLTPRQSAMIRIIYGQLGDPCCQPLFGQKAIGL